MPFEREFRIPKYRDANEGLGEYPQPYNRVEVDSVTGNSVSVVVEHVTGGLEPVVSRFETKQENPETKEQLLFDALSDALSEKGTLLERRVTDDKKTEVRFMDSYGELWTSTGDDFVEASTNGLEAVKRSLM